MKKENRNHNHTIVLRLNDEQYMQLKHQLELCGLTQSEFLRNVIEGYDIKPPPPPELHKILYELQKIGNNVNQIAHVANALHIINFESYNELSNKLNNVIDEIKARID